jgi:hypothetical protein
VKNCVGSSLDFGTVKKLGAGQRIPQVPSIRSGVAGANLRQTGRCALDFDPLQEAGAGAAEACSPEKLNHFLRAEGL